MAQKMHFMTDAFLSGTKRAGKNALLREPAIPRDPMRSKRAALTKRLKDKADAGDRGESVSLAGLSDDELIAALKTR